MVRIPLRTHGWHVLLAGWLLAAAFVAYCVQPLPSVFAAGKVRPKRKRRAKSSERSSYPMIQINNNRKAQEVVPQVLAGVASEGPLIPPHCGRLNQLDVLSRGAGYPGTGPSEFYELFRATMKATKKHPAHLGYTVRTLSPVLANDSVLSLTMFEPNRLMASGRHAVHVAINPGFHIRPLHEDAQQEDRIAGHVWGSTSIPLDHPVHAIVLAPIELSRDMHGANVVALLHESAHYATMEMVRKYANGLAEGKPIAPRLRPYIRYENAHTVVDEGFMRLILEGASEQVEVQASQAVVPLLEERGYPDDRGPQTAALKRGHVMDAMRDFPGKTGQIVDDWSVQEGNVFELVNEVEAILKDGASGR